MTSVNQTKCNPRSDTQCRIPGTHCQGSNSTLSAHNEWHLVNHWLNADGPLMSWSTLYRTDFVCVEIHTGPGNGLRPLEQRIPGSQVPGYGLKGYSESSG